MASEDSLLSDTDCCAQSTRTIYRNDPPQNDRYPLKVAADHDNGTMSDQPKLCDTDESHCLETVYLDPYINMEDIPLSSANMVCRNSEFVSNVETIPFQRGNLAPKEAWTNSNICTDDELECISISSVQNGASDSINQIKLEDSLHINNLPNEILRKILSYCSHQDLCHSVAPVCQFWKDLAFDPIHWLEINLNNHENLSDNDLIRIFQRASLLKHLVMRRESVCNACIIPPLCPNLKSVDMGFNTEFDEHILELFAKHCNLESINIEGCKPVTLISVAFLCKMKKLRNIILSHCHSMQDDDIIELANELPELQMLNIDGISWITDRSIQELVTRHWDSLVHLDLDGAELTDDSIIALSRCIKLQVLRISFCDLLTDIALHYIQAMAGLKHLKLKKGVSFSAEGLRGLFAAGKLNQIEDLNLTECVDFWDDGVKELVKCCGSSLISLDLGWCWNITEAGLQDIVLHCRNITHLTLIGQKQISGECFAHVPKTMPYLEMLDLTQCNEINDNLVLEVFGQSSTIKVLDYYGQEIRDQ